MVKKNRVNIKQIAVNFRFKNLVKQSSFDDRKMEKFLDAMEILINKYSIPSSDAASLLFSIIETMLRENIEPRKLKEEIKSQIAELREIGNQIETSKKILEETKATAEEQRKKLKEKQKDLDQFHEISMLLEVYKYPEISTEYGALVRAMIEFKKLGYDPKVIVSKYEEFESLTKANEELEAKLKDSEQLLQHYRRKSAEKEAKWKDRGIAFEIFARLIKNGLKEEDIFMAVNVLKNDFPQSEIKPLLDDIRTYGNIAAAKSKLKREYEEENEALFEDY
jgi:transposase